MCSYSQPEGGGHIGSQKPTTGLSLPARASRSAFDSILMDARAGWAGTTVGAKDVAERGASESILIERATTETAAYVERRVDQAGIADQVSTRGYQIGMRARPRPRRPVAPRPRAHRVSIIERNNISAVVCQ
jgi:hypothetical protein